ncbi:MAG: hypothetical protein WAZ34_00065 [Rhodocyclaceae bacterium]
MPPHQKGDAAADRLPDGYASSLQAIGRVNALLVTRCLELEARTVNLVSAEIAGWWREMTKPLEMAMPLKPLNSTQPLRPLPERYAGPFGDPHSALEMQEISRQWLELASIMQSALVQAFLGSFVHAAATVAGADPIPKSRFAPERRVSGLVIPFPDRRATQG